MGTMFLDHSGLSINSISLLRVCVNEGCQAGRGVMYVVSSGNTRRDEETLFMNMCERNEADDKQQCWDLASVPSFRSCQHLPPIQPSVSLAPLVQLVCYPQACLPSCNTHTHTHSAVVKGEQYRQNEGHLHSSSPTSLFKAL